MSLFFPPPPCASSYLSSLCVSMRLALRCGPILSPATVLPPFRSQSFTYSFSHLASFSLSLRGRVARLGIHVSFSSLCHSPVVVVASFSFFFYSPSPLFPVVSFPTLSWLLIAHVPHSIRGQCFTILWLAAYLFAPLFLIFPRVSSLQPPPCLPAQRAAAPSAPLASDTHTCKRRGEKCISHFPLPDGRSGNEVERRGEG
ncbi:hypothetical protein TRSC58_07259 [Trypanosoma rangeli SC58]|uniref:Transmembrane protein n=1 Tax=Trypanosoma rangeli SC58 TaxID=429131 RepID=A0A061IT73_TRYRA|nr:hypothetical protein TRSC58_07259 [Trypanosoma rangeli SC58]